MTLLDYPVRLAGGGWSVNPPGALAPKLCCWGIAKPTNKITRHNTINALHSILKLTRIIKSLLPHNFILKWLDTTMLHTDWFVVKWKPSRKGYQKVSCKQSNSHQYAKSAKSERATKVKKNMRLHCIV